MSKEQLTEDIKFRVTAEQKQAIKQAAEKDGVSVSDLLRNTVFDPGEGYQITPVSFIFQAQYLGDPHGNAAEQDIAFHCFECFVIRQFLRF